MSKPRNKNDAEIPEILKEAFYAMREPDQPGQTFALTSAEINGNLSWVIAAIDYDRKTEEINVIMPIFQGIPRGAKVVVNGMEAEDISDQFDKPLFNGDIPCPICDRLKRAVSMKLPGSANQEEVIWCSAGHVCIINKGRHERPKLVYEFNDPMEGM